MDQPMQPIYRDKDGIIRFWPNAIVRYLLDASRDGRKTDMNDLALMPFSVEDREQFAQLIGYSVSGFGDLSYVRVETIEQADDVADSIR